MILLIIQAIFIKVKDESCDIDMTLGRLLTYITGAFFMPTLVYFGNLSFIVAFTPLMLIVG